MPKAQLVYFFADPTPTRSVDIELHAASDQDGLAWTVGQGGVVRKSVEEIIGTQQVGSTSMQSWIYFLQGLDNSRQLCAVKTDSRHICFSANYRIGPFKQNNHILISLRSGSCYAEKFYEDVISPLLGALGTDNYFTVQRTSSEASIVDYARSILLPAAKDGQAQHVVLLAGDGGIVDIVNELSPDDGPIPVSYHPPTISLIPMGTGNALAHSTGIFDGTLGIAAWLRGQEHVLPLFRVSFPRINDGAKVLLAEGRMKADIRRRSEHASYLWGAVVFSWGFHAQIVADSDTTEFRKHGVDRFKMAAQEALFPADGTGPHDYRGTITTLQHEDGTSMTWGPSNLGDSHSYVLGTLVSKLESGFTVSPASKPLSRNLKLVHIRHTSGDEIGRLMSLAYQGGKHVDDDAVSYLDVAGFTLELHEEEEKWRRVCIDGKIIVVEQGGGRVIVEKESSDLVKITALVH